MTFPSAEQAFAERFAIWQQLHRQEGTGRSYPYAWRLPELARPLGRIRLSQARHALALDLYILGRFQEALTALSEAGEGETEQDQILRHRLVRLLDQPAGEVALEGGLPVAEVAYLAYLQDRPLDWPAGTPALPGEADQRWWDVLRTWSLARLGEAPSLAASHRALARLRRLYPVLGAQAEAVHAETVFLLGPRWAVVWLDLALDQVERYSQHHLKARLLGLKARALEAAGELGEGGRFRKQARALAERQGARLYQRLFIEPL
jgi:hypothetical protein